MIAILPSDPRYEQINALQTMYADVINKQRAYTAIDVEWWDLRRLRLHLERELWELTADPMIRRWIGYND